MPAKTEKLKETQMAETQAVETEEQPAEAPDDGMVNIFLMRDSDKYKGDVFVQVNGRSYIVKRGRNFDVYRLGDVDEMDEIGYEDYFYGEGICLIEWSERIREILPEHPIQITIEKDLEKGFDYRKISVNEQ